MTKNEWSEHGIFFTPRTRAGKVPALPAGVFTFQPTMGGWGLNRIDDRFEFPFKIYDAHDYIIERVVKFWEAKKGPLGVWLNGVRGAGKTVVAQQVANELINRFETPVIIIRDPIPLDAVLAELNQDVVIIFDEFEKTHDQDEQQQLLSAIDGLSRSSHGRVFIFTTNRTDVDENYKDRPSRIRYVWNFQRVSSVVVEGLINDLLPEHLGHLREEVLLYFENRDVLTMDVVKQVLQEVITFEESPADFASFFNVKASSPPQYRVFILDYETGEPVKVFEELFKLSNTNWQSLIQGSPVAVENFVQRGYEVRINADKTYGSGKSCELLGWDEKHQAFIANLSIPVTETHWNSIARSEHDDSRLLWVDPRPVEYEGIPNFWMSEDDKDTKRDRKKAVSRYWNAVRNGTVHGDFYREGEAERGTFLIRFEPNRERPNLDKVYTNFMNAF